MVNDFSDERIEQMAKVIADSFIDYPLIKAVIGEIPNLEDVMLKASYLNTREFLKHGDAHLLDGNPEALVLAYHSKSIRPMTRTIHTIRLVLLLRRLLSKDDFKALMRNLKRYDKVMDLKWPYRHIDGEFYYVKVVAVDHSLRGTGAFRRLMTPVIEGSALRGLPIVLESHDERVADIYTHYGFDTVELIEQEGLDIRQHCMVLQPNDGNGA